MRSPLSQLQSVSYSRCELAMNVHQTEMMDSGWKLWEIKLSELLSLRPGTDTGSQRQQDAMIIQIVILLFGS